MKIKIFIDSSVFIAALLSETGGSAKVLNLCEVRILEGFISRKVIEEVERNIGRKFPDLKPYFDRVLKNGKLIVSNIKSKNSVKIAEKLISDKNDAPILAAAKSAKVDVLLTLDIRHFIRDPNVSKKSGLKIMTPGEFLQGFWKIVLNSLTQGIASLQIIRAS